MSGVLDRFWGAASPRKVPESEDQQETAAARSPSRSTTGARTRVPMAPIAVEPEMDNKPSPTPEPASSGISPLKPIKSMLNALMEPAEAKSPSRRSKEATRRSGSAELGSAPVKTPKKRRAAAMEETEADETKKPEDQKKNAGDDDAKEWVIDKFVNHRFRKDDLEIQVQWEDGDVTWEPELSLHADAPQVLFAYWKKVGGRPSKPGQEELFNVFAIRGERARAKKKQLLVEWLGYKERSWEPHGAIVEAAPELVEEFENTKPARGRGAKRVRKQ